MAKYCRYCGSEISENAVFCKSCGKQLPKEEPQKIQAAAPKFCRSCGSPLSPDALFCRACGQKVISAAEQEAARKDSAAPDRRTIYQETIAASKKPDSPPPQTAQNARKRPAAAPAAAGARTRGGGFPAKPVIAAVLALAVFLAFIYPGPVRKAVFDSRSGGGTHVAGGTSGNGSGSASGTGPHAGAGSGKGKASGWEQVSAEARPPMIAGNSKAFDLEPVEGLRISAEENAMDYDREVKVTELEGAELLELAEQLQEEDQLLLSAYDLDLGMTAGEYLPGYYHVDIDLSGLGIPEELYDDVRVTRIDDNGDRFVYAAERNGKTLSYKSRQNSLLVTSLLIASLAGVAGKYICDEVSAETAYYNNKTLMVKELPHFIVYFAAEDLIGHGVPDDYLKYAREMQARKEAIPLEIEAKYSPENYTRDQDYRTMLESSMKRQSDIILAYKTALENDPQYQEKKQLMEEAYPQEVNRICEYLEMSRAYLESPEQNLRTPGYKMKIYLKERTDGSEAFTHKILFQNPSMQVALGQIYENLESGPVSASRYREDRMEALLCSISHELTHACQYEYYTSGMSELISASLKLVEASACVTEVEALKHFAAAGVLPALAGQTMEQLYGTGAGSSGALTPRDYPEWYAIPMDEPSPSTGGSYVGYAYAYFLDFLNEHAGYKKTSELMEHYYAGMAFSTDLMAAHELEGNIFQFHFIDSMGEQRDSGMVHKAILENSIMAEQQHYGTYAFSVNKNQLLYKEERDQARGGNVYYNGLFMKLHRFTVEGDTVREGKKALLVVPDPDNSMDGDVAAAIQDTTKELYELRFADNGETLPDVSKYLLDKVKNILWIEDMSNSSYVMSEIAGAEFGWETKHRISFDAMALTPPGNPEIYANAPARGKATFRLPKDANPFYTNAYVKKQMQESGFCVRVPGETDPKKMQFFKGEQVGTDVVVEAKDLHINEKDFSDVVGCAYFKLNDKYYFGPESETQEDIFGTYDINVVTKEYSSSLDALVSQIPKEYQGYKDTYKNETQKLIGVPQAATLTVINNGVKGASIEGGGTVGNTGTGGIGSSISYDTGNGSISISDPLGLASGGSDIGNGFNIGGSGSAIGTEILVILTYNDAVNGTVDLSSYGSQTPGVYTYRGVIPADQKYTEGGKGMQSIKVHLEADETGQGAGMNLFVGPLDLEFLRDAKNRYSVKGESKYGYGNNRDQTISFTYGGDTTSYNSGKLGIRYWFTLEGKKRET